MACDHPYDRRPAAMEAYPTPAAGAFEPARRLFDSIETKLRSEEMLSMAHAELEDILRRDAHELFRLLFQGHLDLRACREERGPMHGADGEVRTHRKRCSRKLMSLFGGLKVHRLSMQRRGADGLRPLDAELNLHADLYSFGVRKQVAEGAALSAFDVVVEQVSRTTGAHVPKRQAEELTVRAAQDFEAFYDVKAREQVPPSALMVLTFDGKGVVMRPDGLRDETRRRATSKKLKHRMSGGEKRNRKRMAQVASVYELEAQPRTPEDIVRELDPDAPGPRVRRPRAQRKRVWASLVQEPGEVIADAFYEAVHRDPDMERRWVAVVDGNGTQIDHVRNLSEYYGTEVTLVLDVIHVIEYLWKAAWCLHEKGDPSAEEWVTERLLRLLRGEVSSVAAGIRRAATKLDLPPDKRAPMDTCADYLLKYKDMLRYDKYLRDGLPIASGVIEGACRHLVNDRMGITGARWGLEGAEAVLKMRALRSSGDLEEYWAFHRRQELERNHLSRYADHELEPLRAAA
jgi:hypothetical protein